MTVVSDRHILLWQNVSVRQYLGVHVPLSQIKGRSEAMLNANSDLHHQRERR